MDKKFVIIAALLMYGISAYFAYSFFAPYVKTLTSGGDFVPVADEIIEPETDDGEFEGPRTQECPINGEMLTDKHRSNWEKRRPLGVAIENSTDSRPQSGLTSADVVYEFVAEGGITRFLGIFYCKDTRFLGPVRSARVYFIDMLQGYGNNPLYAHVGGANTPGPADALGKIDRLRWSQYNDLNQFSIPFPTYYRDYSRLQNVATEHTMYSSTEKLWSFAAEKRKLTEVDEDGVRWDEAYDSWTFADGKPGAGSVSTIAYDFWEGKKPYSVSWKYDAKANTYVRSHGDGVQHTDLNNKKPISPKNVVVMFVKESVANDGYEGQHMLYGTLGKGDALIFQNGEAIKATWRKQKETDLVHFYDTAGDPVPMVRGQVWISGVPIGNKVAY